MQKPQLPDAVLATLSELLNGVLSGVEADLALIAELLYLPSFDTLSSGYSEIPVDALNSIITAFETDIAKHLSPQLEAVVEQFKDDKQQTAQSAGVRALLAACMYYLARLDTAIDYIAEQANSGSMTLSLAALKALVLAQHQQQNALLGEFARRWADDVLVLDKWFNLQAMKQGEQALSDIGALFEHPHFSWQNPNRVRALLGPLTMSNPRVFHHKDGRGYELLGDVLVKLNEINPQNASRLITPLLAWRRYDAGRQQLMRAQLQRLMALPNLSKDLFEKVEKALSE